MIDFVKSDKIRKVKKWINQTLRKLIYIYIYTVYHKSEYTPQIFADI